MVRQCAPVVMMRVLRLAHVLPAVTMPGTYVAGAEGIVPSPRGPEPAERPPRVASLHLGLVLVNTP